MRAVLVLPLLAVATLATCAPTVFQPEVRPQQVRARVDVLAEHRLGAVELAPHPDVLRPLPGEQEHHRRVVVRLRAARDAAGRGAAQSLDDLGTDSLDARGSLGPGGLLWSRGLVGLG